MLRFAVKFPPLLKQDLLPRQLRLANYAFAAAKLSGKIGARKSSERSLPLRTRIDVAPTTRFSRLLNHNLLLVMG